MNRTAYAVAVMRPVIPLGMTCGCGGAMTAYQYAWLRAQALAAQQAWARFDVRSN